MTGIERLRALAFKKNFLEPAEARELDAIADQIERETQPKHDPAADATVSAYDLLPQEDREAVAWVREHGGLDYVRAEWRSRVPYDRYVARRQRLLGHIAECETALGRRNDRIEELGRRVNDLTTENAELRKRAMPEGMEWPRYESGELVMLGDTVTKYVGGGTIKVRSVEFLENMTYLHERFKTDQIAIVRPGERVKRPAVLAADGEPLEVGQTVWAIDDTGMDFDEARVVDSITSNGRFTVRGVLSCITFDPKRYSHQRPVLDAEGVPIREGDTVYGTKDMSYQVTELCEYEPSIVHAKAIDGNECGDEFISGNPRINSMQLDASKLTHRAPVLAADGKPLREGETVWYVPTPGEAIECVVDELPDRDKGEGQVTSKATGRNRTIFCPPSYLTHERPDSWERLEEDARMSPSNYCLARGLEGMGATYGDAAHAMARDLVRRARALAGGV